MSAAAPVTTPETRTEPLGTLARRLAFADRILQKERGGSLLLRGSPWIAGFVLAAFAADVALHLAGGVRLGITAGFRCVMPASDAGAPDRAPAAANFIAGTVFARAMLRLVVLRCASANGMAQMAISRSR